MEAMKCIQLNLYSLLLILIASWSCDRDQIGPQDDRNGDGSPSSITPGSVLILNEGNFMRGNASLSSYHPEQEELIKQVYQNANADIPLGDVAQELRPMGDYFYISLNTTGVILKLEKQSLEEEARSRAIGTPLYMAQRGDSLLVTDLYKSQLRVLSRSTLEVRGKIKLPFSGRHLAWWQGRLALSSDRGLILLNSSTTAFDTLLPTPAPLGEIEPGLQGALWALGQYAGPDSLLRWQAPDTKPESYALPGGGDARFLEQLRDTLYGMSGKTVWRFPLSASVAAPQPWINTPVQTPYALGIDPYRGDCYVADALNFDQEARVLRYGRGKALQDSFRAGPISNQFHFIHP